jgi:hypothetical protein
MSRPLPPPIQPLHPSYTLVWLALHTWGLACLFVPWPDSWAWYYIAVAVFEGVGLALAWAGKRQGRMWSPNVWAWMHDDFGKHIGWRVFVVAAWSLYFCGAFMVVQPWFGELDFLIGMVCLVWLWAHFLHERRSNWRPHG